MYYKYQDFKTHEIYHKLKHHLQHSQIRFNASKDQSLKQHTEYLPFSCPSSCIKEQQGKQKAKSVSLTGYFNYWDWPQAESKSIFLFSIWKLRLQTAPNILEMYFQVICKMLPLTCSNFHDNTHTNSDDWPKHNRKNDNLAAFYNFIVIFTWR